MSFIKIKVYAIDYRDDPVSGGTSPVLTTVDTIATVNLQFLVETHLDPSGIFAYVNLSTGQVFTTSPEEYNKINSTVFNTEEEDNGS